MDKLRTLIGFMAGYRTQLLMILYASAETLKVLGVLDTDTADRIEQILLPLAGFTFAAKVNRLGKILLAVIGPVQ